MRSSLLVCVVAGITVYTLMLMWTTMSDLLLLTVANIEAIGR